MTIKENVYVGEESGWEDGVEGILDTGYLKIVCGEKWLARVVMSIREEDRKIMVREHREIKGVRYVFGNSRYEAFKSVRIP